MIKKLTLKLFLVAFILNFFNIGTTNSYFTSRVTVANNTVSAGCWTKPNIPVLLTPENNSYLGLNSGWNINPVMDWDNATSSCPTAGAITYQYESYTDPLLQHLAYRSNWLNNSFIPAPGTPENNYYWRVRSRDSIGNTSDFSTLWHFTVDRTLPDSIITNPFNSGNNQIGITISSWNGIIQGTAFDSLSGLDRIEISIQKDSDKFWNGTNWVFGSESSIRVGTTGTTNWNYQISGVIPSGSYRIISHAIDKAGNIENSATIEFENKEIITPPEPTTTPTPVPEPDFSVSLNRYTHHLSFATANFAAADITYEVLYQDSNGDQGIAGVIPSTDIIDGVVNRDFYLGSCTSGGTCTPDAISVGSSLSVNLNNNIKTIAY